MPLREPDRFVLEVRDKDLVVTAPIANLDVTDFAATKRRGQVGSWGLSLPATSPACRALARPGAGVIATLNGLPLLTGPMVQYKRRRDPQSGVSDVVFTGVDDACLLFDHLAYPQPGNANPATQTAAFDVRGDTTGVTREDVMVAYVAANIGPSAPTGRRRGYAARLRAPQSLARGARSPRYAARFEKLGELLQSVGGPDRLQADVVQDGTELVLTITAGRDLTGSVRFSLQNQTADSYEYTVSAPGLTQAIVGGDGTGSSRTIVARTSTSSTAAEAAWGRAIDTFVNYSGTGNVGEQEAAGDEPLVKDGRTVVTVDVEPVNTSTVQFRRDWYLGDTVSVELPDVLDSAGVPVNVSEVIEEVQFTHGVDGFRATATLGDPDVASQDRVTAMMSVLYDARRRTSSIERRK